MHTALVALLSAMNAININSSIAEAFIAHDEKQTGTGETFH